MDYSSIETKDYEIIYDTSTIDTEYDITPEIEQILQELYPEIQRGKQSTIKKLIKYCHRYPHIPHFKNYLEVAYQQSGKTQMAVKLNRRTIKEHPDYLFGKLNHANLLLVDGEPHKVPEVLGEELDLKVLYPHRETFHLREILGFMKICVRYYLAINELNKAEECVFSMNDIGPDEIETEEASLRLIRARMESATRRLEEENKRRRSVESRSYDKSVQTSKKPVFNHAEIETLYASDMGIDHSIIRKILELPQASLIEDLETVLEDSIRRFEHFRELDRQNEVWEPEKFSFLWHALFLLAELKAEESLPKVLRLLRQGEEFLDFWFSDMLNQILRDVIFQVGRHRLPDLRAFMKERENYAYARNTVSTTLTQLAFHRKDRRPEVIDWFDDLFRFFLINAEDYQIIDTDLISFMVCDCVDLEAVELEERIQALYDRGLVEPGITGIAKEIFRDMKSGQYMPSEYQIHDIFSRYDYLVDLGHSGVNESIFQPYLEMKANAEQPFVSQKKVGRNDPCPCGSGKKYKHCCMR